MADDKKNPKEASNIFHSIMKASVTPKKVEKKDADFVAEIKYKTTEDGGRKGFILSGYRAQVKFPFTDMQTSGHQEFHNREKVYPGETITATINIGSPELFANSLQVGTEFEIREGAHIVGNGRLTKIINETLIKP